MLADTLGGDGLQNLGEIVVTRIPRVVEQAGKSAVHGGAAILENSQGADDAKVVFVTPELIRDDDEALREIEGLADVREERKRVERERGWEGSDTGFRREGGKELFVGRFRVVAGEEDTLGPLGELEAAGVAGSDLGFAEKVGRADVLEVGNPADDGAGGLDGEVDERQDDVDLLGGDCQLQRGGSGLAEALAQEAFDAAGRAVVAFKRNGADVLQRRGLAEEGGADALLSGEHAGDEAGEVAAARPCGRTEVCDADVHLARAVAGAARDNRDARAGESAEFCEVLGLGGKRLVLELGDGHPAGGGYGVAFDDPCGGADGDGERRKIAEDDGSGADDGAETDGCGRKDLHLGAEPDIRAEAEFTAERGGLADVGAEGVLDAVVGTDEAAVGAGEAVVAEFDEGAAVEEIAPSDEAMRADADGRALVVGRVHVEPGVLADDRVLADFHGRSAEDLDGGVDREVAFQQVAGAWRRRFSEEAFHWARKRRARTSGSGSAVSRDS